MERIINTSDHIAHVVLVALCNEPNTLARVLPLVNQLEERQRQGALNGTKRKADDVDLLVCSECGQFFVEGENNSGACAFHEGELEPDEDGDFWADHDGEVDTPENRANFPEGFFWNCCGKHGDENEPCARGPHVAARGGTLKRGRYEDNAESVAEDEDEEESYFGDEVDEETFYPNDAQNPTVIDDEDDDDDDAGEGAQEDEGEESDDDEEDEDEDAVETGLQH